MNNNFKFEFPLTKKVIYFENATLGLCPRSTIKVIKEYIEERCVWMLGSSNWIENKNKWLKDIEQSKVLFSNIIGSKKSEVTCLSPSAHIYK